jgi:hypothetical protein
MTTIAIEARPATGDRMNARLVVHALAETLRRANAALPGRLEAAAATILIAETQARLDRLTQSDPLAMFWPEADRLRDLQCRCGAILAGDHADDALRLRRGLQAVAPDRDRFSVWLDIAGAACAILGTTLSAGPATLSLTIVSRPLGAWWAVETEAKLHALRLDAFAVERVMERLL